MQAKTQVKIIAKLSVSERKEEILQRSTSQQICGTTLQFARTRSCESKLKVFLSEEPLDTIE
jgi:hypothetical protein